METNPEAQHDDADESQHITNLSKQTKLGVLAVISVLASLVAYGAVKGFNASPRAEGGVTLSNPELDMDLKCVRDTFHDAVSGASFKNKWVAENCDPEIKARIKQALSQENPLKALVHLRNEIFAESGEYPPEAEKWYQSYQGQSEGFDARIEINQEALMRAQIDQREKAREAQMKQYQQGGIIKPAATLHHKGTTRQQRGQ